MKNSGDSPHSSFAEILGVTALLALIVALAIWYFYAHGYLLYYGDAQAHLNISRSYIDSRTPGYDQLGTVWLPILHVICLPFVSHNFLWQTGLAGTIPVAACFIVAGLCLYLSAKDVYQSSPAGLMVLLCFALNPNVLYLASITMTEIVFIAGLAFCLLAILRYRRTQSNIWLVLGVLSSWWMSLTRYDGWFLIPFIAAFFAWLTPTAKLKTFFSVSIAASCAPIYWFAHNWWEQANPLDFYNGPYSAAAIQANRPYPGFHDWLPALHYYSEAGRLCCGNALLIVAALGLLIAIFQRRWLAVIFLSLTPLFYIWSIHSSQTPIHVPTLWPFSYYNTRYGIAVVVLAAFACGALATVLPRRLALLVPLIAILPWCWKPSPDKLICWKESQVNSDDRRAWTAQAARFFQANYHTGDGILIEFGDLTAILGKAGIPLKESLHEGNTVQWFANTMPNGVVRQMKWAIAQQGDKLSTRLDEAKAFHLVEAITVKDAPNLLIYERN